MVWSAKEMEENRLNGRSGLVATVHDGRRYRQVESAATKRENERQRNVSFRFPFVDSCACVFLSPRARSDRRPSVRNHEWQFTPPRRVFTNPPAIHKQHDTYIYIVLLASFYTEKREKYLKNIKYPSGADNIHLFILM